MSNIRRKCSDWRIAYCAVLLIMVLPTWGGDTSIWRPRISFPVDPMSPTIPEVPPGAINEALHEAHEILQQQKLIEKNSIGGHEGKLYSSGMCPAAVRHTFGRIADDKAMSMDDIAAIFEETTKIVSRKMKMFWEDEFHGLARTDLSGTKLSNVVDQCHVMMHSHHCEHKPYRELDGSCNNLQNPYWGSAFSCMTRLLPPRYADGVSIPRISETGLELPNPRMVSTTIHVDFDRPHHECTHMLMQWGQFLDHDFALSPIMAKNEKDIVDLGNPNTVVDCCSPEKRHSPKCFSFDLPESDHFFSKFGEHCMNFPRSARCPMCTLGPREQIDALTAYIDGSQIYGSSLEDSLRLRTHAGDGRLKFDIGRRGDMLLPASFQPFKDRCSRPEEGDLCFRAGDERVNEQPGLTAMHTLWLRHHNGLADKLTHLNPHWDDERIYQETRRIVVAQLQKITYAEFLPLVLGPSFYKEFGLDVLPYGYTTYNKHINPSILNEFAGAVFRFGHTILNGKFMEINSHGQRRTIDLKSNFFKPFEFRHGKMERIMRGLSKQHMQTFDNFITHDVTNHLYKLENETFGLDLISLNIQRGRDHGLRGYTDYLKGCFGKEINTFEELDIVMPRPVRERLERLYAHVNDIDLFTGGVSEYPLPGGVVGPTFGCIMGIQFWRLKYGDRFYFEHGGQDGSFTPAQLTEIRQVTMGRIVCDNSVGQQFMQEWVFMGISERNPELPCQQLKTMNMNAWIEIPGNEKKRKK